jgi:hypothetical protein
VKTKTRKSEIAFDAEALVARVEGFAAGRQPAREGPLKLPPPAKPGPQLGNEGKIKTPPA